MAPGICKHQLLSIPEHYSDVAMQDGQEVLQASKDNQMDDGNLRRTRTIL